MVGNLRFPACRAWENGPRRIHITRTLLMEIDYKEKDFLYVAKFLTSDSQTITIYVNSVLDVMLPATNGVYHLDLGRDIYKVYKNEDLQTVIALRSFDNANPDEDATLEQYVDLKLVADY